MARVYKTVRLACESKIWIDELITLRSAELQAELEKGLSTNLEDSLLELNPDVLNGVSVNVVLKVTNGSVIEQGVRDTLNYDVPAWRDIMVQMETAIRGIRNRKVIADNDITPRLYLSQETLKLLGELQLKLKSEGHGLPRLSYIIKLVVYASYCQKISKQ